MKPTVPAACRTGYYARGPHHGRQVHKSAWHLNRRLLARWDREIDMPDSLASTYVILIRLWLNGGVGSRCFHFLNGNMWKCVDRISICLSLACGLRAIFRSSVLRTSALGDIAPACRPRWLISLFNTFRNATLQLLREAELPVSNHKECCQEQEHPHSRSPKCAKRSYERRYHAVATSLDWVARLLGSSFWHHETLTSATKKPKWQVTRVAEVSMLARQTVPVRPPIMATERVSSLVAGCLIHSCSAQKIIRSLDSKISRCERAWELAGLKPSHINILIFKQFDDTSYRLFKASSSLGGPVNRFDQRRSLPTRNAFGLRTRRCVRTTSPMARRALQFLIAPVTRSYITKAKGRPLFLDF